jgi:hypothetical protein
LNAPAFKANAVFRPTLPTVKPVPEADFLQIIELVKDFGDGGVSVATPGNNDFSGS